MEKVLTKTEATVRVQEIMYKAVVQTLVLYGRDISVVTEAMLKVLEGLHHWLACMIAGMLDCIVV